MRPGSLMAVFVACIVALAAQPAHGEIAEVKWHECTHYDSGLFRPLRCGHLFIGDPTTASLPFAVIQSDLEGPSDTAVLFLQGGPGASSGLDPLEFYWRTWAEAALLPVDLVVFDQRGTGIAWPASGCIEYHDVVRPALAAGMFSRRSLDLLRAAKADCHEELVSSGYDLRQFTVRRMADDARALMDALSYSGWTIWGTSYGSRVALEIMRDQPDEVRSAVLDGVVPPDIDLWLEEPALLDNAMAMIDRVCPRWRMERPSCLRYAGDFMGSLEMLLEDFAGNPRWISVDDWSGQKPYKVRVGPPELLYTLYAAASVTDGANFARDAVIDAAHGDFELLDLLLQSWAAGQTDLSMNEATHFSVTCNFSGARTQEEFLRQVPPAQLYDRYIGRPSFDHPCEDWTISRAPEHLRQPVISSIPTLLISGEYDWITPSSWGDRVAANLDNSRHYVIRRGGHGVLIDDWCALRIFGAFLVDPNTEPDSACIDEKLPGIRDP